MSVDPSSFRIEPDDPWDASRVAGNESVFSASRVNLTVPAYGDGSQAALRVPLESQRSPSQVLAGPAGPSPDFELQHPAESQEFTLQPDASVQQIMGATN